ncbi:MAG: FAD-binding oxidoreductase, partial [Candidatus Methanomethylophilaceae archaeon]|nr:FAD-binding oxidoreductase [Candidatus Methanomethylophilaceae archaeon]
MQRFSPDPDSPYTIDECKIRGNADFVFIPDDEEELRSELVRCNDEGIPVTINAMRTGLCGGGVPEGGEVISLERMDRMIGIGQCERGFFVRTQPCVTVRKLRDTILMKHIDGFADVTPGACDAFRNDKRKFFYPVDPTEMDGSIGGNIATNASGPRTFKYGPTRNWVISIKLILTDGRVLRVDRGKHFAEGRHFSADVDGIHLEFDMPSYDFNTSVKNAGGLYSKEGMDLIDVFIGSEGILGVIAEADVLLTEWHPLISNIAFMPDDASALSLIKDVRHDSMVSPEFLEYFDCASIDLVRRSYSCDPNIPAPPKERCSAVFFDLADESCYDTISKIAEKNGGSLNNS